jgi:hypothetical protein
LIRGQGIEEQFIVNGWTGGAKCFFPALARPMARRDHETIILDPQLDEVLESALLDNWLRTPREFPICTSSTFIADKHLVSTL